MIRIFALFFILSIISCSKGPVPKDILPPKKMEVIVGDVIKVDEFINNFVLKDTSIDVKKKRTELYEKVFLLHKTTRKDFYTSFRYYQAHPDIQKVLFDSLSNHLNNIKQDTIKREMPKTINAQ
jgi:hypothetical protein